MLCKKGLMRIINEYCFYFWPAIMHTKKMILAAIFIFACTMHTGAIAAVYNPRATKKLKHAVEISNATKARKAFAKGADPNAWRRDNYSRAPLFLIVADKLRKYVAWGEHEEAFQWEKKECREIIKEFVNQKADCNILDYQKTSIATHLAVAGELELVKIIIDHYPALKNVIDSSGYNILLYTAMNRRLRKPSTHETYTKKTDAMYEFFVREVGVDIHYQDKEGNTALYVEILNDESAARCLIKLGANINEKNYLGDTILSKLLYREPNVRGLERNILPLERFFELGGDPWSMYAPVNLPKDRWAKKRLELILEHRKKCMLMAQATDKLFDGKLPGIQLLHVYPYLGMNYPDGRSKRLQQVAADYNELERQEKQNLQKLSQGHLKKPRMIKRKAVPPYKGHSLIKLPLLDQAVAVEPVD
jgi:hypothetical protein